MGNAHPREKGEHLSVGPRVGVLLQMKQTPPLQFILLLDFPSRLFSSFSSRICLGSVLTNYTQLNVIANSPERQHVI